jgi:hypothetical protein
VAAAIYNNNPNRSRTSEAVKPMDFFGAEIASNDGEELTPGIRPASVILAEIERAVAAVKG